MENGDMKMGKMCGCGCHKVMPILVILFGLDFLLGMLGVLTAGFVSISWPILIIIAGCMMLFKKSCSCWMKHEGKAM
jgi:hypothetical protein